MNELLTHHSGGRHGDEEASGDDPPPPAGCREELQNPPGLGLTMTAATELFVDGGSGL